MTRSTCDAAARREPAGVGAQLRGRRDAVVQQPRAVPRVRPGARHDGGAHEVAPEALETLDAGGDLCCAQGSLRSSHLLNEKKT